MSLKGQRASKKSREQARRRYAIIHAVGYHNQPPNKPFLVPWKLFIVLGIILGGIFAPSYIYYSTVYVPSIPSPSARPDPFTTLWNGQTPSVQPGFNALSFNDLCSAGVNCTSTLSHNTAGNDLLFFSAWTWSGSCTSPKISDSQGNTWTQYGTGSTNFAINWTIGTLPTAYWAQSSQTTPDTITWNCGTVASGYTVLDYFGFKGFGNERDNGSVISPTTSILSMPVSLESIVVQVGFNHRSAIVCNSMTLNSTNNRHGQICNAGTLPAGTSMIAQWMDNGPFLTAQTVARSGIFGALPTDAFWHSIVEIKLTAPSSSCSTLFNCVNAQIGTDGNVLLSPNSTTSAVAISTSAVDLSTGSSKSLAFSEQTNLFGGFGSGGNQLYANEEYGWFLSLNSTAPGSNIGTSQSWSPLNDSNIVLYVEGFVVSSGVENYYVYMSRQAGQKLQILSTDNPFPRCPQSSSLFVCSQNTKPATSQFLMSLVLNFTGAQTGSGASCNSNGLGPACSYLCLPGGSGNTCTVGGAANNFVTYTNVIFAENFTQPWLNLQNQYYLGFWTQPNPNANTVTFLTSKANPQNNIVSVYIPTVPSNGPQDTGGFFGWVGRSLGGAWNAAAGALAPISGPLSNLGNSFLAVVASGLIQAGNLLIKGLGLLAGLIVVTLNVIGNALGLGNIGNDIATLLTNFQTFFTNQLPTAFSNLGTLFSQWFQSLTILFAWVPIALSIAANLLTIGINAISFLLLVVQDLFLLWDTMIVLMLLLFWFADIGEYGLSGFHVWFETMKYLVFGLGVGPLLDTIHYGTDIILLMVGIIPKPIIQIAAKFDTIIPSIHISGSPTWPSFTMEEVRKGNYFSVGGFLIGVIVLVWFETTSLPGSITALVPGVGVSLTRLAGVPNLLLIFLEIFGFMALFILPAQLFQSMGLGLSTAALGNLQFRRGPGVQVGSVGVSVSRREPGRILQRAEKKIGNNLNAPAGNVSEKRMEQLTKQLGSENIN